MVKHISKEICFGKSLEWNTLTGDTVQPENFSSLSALEASLHSLFPTQNKILKLLTQLLAVPLPEREGMCAWFLAHWAQKKITGWLQESHWIWLVLPKLIIYLLKNLLPESERGPWYLVWNSCGKTLCPSPSSTELGGILLPKQVHGTWVALVRSWVSSFQGKLDSVN